MTVGVVVAARGVWFGYGGGADVLRGVTFELAAGEAGLMWGLNGAGKTTLGKVLAGVLKPRRGEVARAGGVGMVLAEPSAMLLGPTPAEDVRLGPAAAGLTEGEVARRVAAALEAVGMTARRDVPCEALSVGERKRVALAAAFALEPAALVLDEPFAFLDDEQEAALWEVIERRRAAGAAFLILSGRREVGRRCGRTWALAEGVARAVV